jgi:Putative prokaryotic signal transducing protein
MASDELVTIETVSNPVEAEIIRNALNAEGIACEIGNENQAAFPGVGALEIEIMTRARDADRARKILAEQERNRTKE